MGAAYETFADVSLGNKVRFEKKFLSIIAIVLYSKEEQTMRIKLGWIRKNRKEVRKEWTELEAQRKELFEKAVAFADKEA